jgi:hypothetical protein
MFKFSDEDMGKADRGWKLGLWQKVASHITNAMKSSLFYFFYCCTGWGYIVAFTKVLTMYQIYHTWIHPLLCSPLSLSPPHSWNSFNRYHFCKYIHVQTVFALH